MKRQFLSILTALTLLTTPTLALLLPPLAAELVLSSGCASANKTAYKATGVAVITVDAAMSAWGSYVKQNHPPASQEQAVKDAFEKYQAAASLVATAGAAHAKVLADRANGGTGDATGAMANLNAAIAIATSSLSDLINLLQTFGVKF